MTYRTLEETRELLDTPVDPDSPVELVDLIDQGIGRSCSYVWIIPTAVLNRFGDVRDTTTSEWRGAVVPIEQLSQWLMDYGRTYDGTPVDRETACLLATYIGDGTDTWSSTPGEDDLQVTVLWRGDEESAS